MDATTRNNTPEDHVQTEKQSIASGREKKQKSPAERRVGYVFGIIFAVVFLWIISNFEAWGWKFITDEWNQVNQIVRISIILNIVIYGIFIINDNRYLFYVGKLLMDGFGIFVSIRIFQVFPFDFNYLFGGWGWLNTLLPWLIVIGIIGVGISIVVRTAKLCIGKNIYF